MLIDAAVNLIQKLSGREVRTGCLACGRCCEAFGASLRASFADVERWREMGRDDILRWVNRLGWLWVDPDTGRRAAACPFLERHEDGTACCRIHEIKPEICRAYPTLAHEKTCVSGRVLGWLAPVLTFPLARKVVLYTQEMLLVETELAHWSGIVAGSL